MKYPHQVVSSHTKVTDKEIQSLASRLAESLRETIPGLDCRLEFQPATDYLKGTWAKFTFAKPLEGRDWEDSRIYCFGFAVLLCHDNGPNMEKGEDGKTKCPAPVVSQFSATFTFFGYATPYRRRIRGEIRNSGTDHFQYDTDLDAIDFTRNIQYLATIRPEKKRK